MQLDLRTNTNFDIVGHPGGSTLDAQGSSRIFDLNYKAALTLKNVTLINGRATAGPTGPDGGAIRLLSRFPASVEVSMNFNAAEAARLTILGGAIRDCEATHDGGAVAAIAASTMMGGAASRAHRRHGLPGCPDCSYYAPKNMRISRFPPPQESTPTWLVLRSAAAGRATGAAPFS